MCEKYATFFLCSCLVRLIFADDQKYFIYNDPPKIKLVDKSYDRLRVELVGGSTTGYASDPSGTLYEHDSISCVVIQYSEENVINWNNAEISCSSQEFPRFVNIESLQSDTSYLFRIFGCLPSQSQSDLSHVSHRNIKVQKEDFRTLCTEPAVQHTVSKPDGIDIELRPDKYRCKIDRYEVQINSEGSLFDNRTATIGENVFHIRNLRSNENYTFCLKPVNVPACTVTTEFATTNKIDSPWTENIKLAYHQNDETNLIHLQWDFENQSLFGKILRFEIEWSYEKLSCPSKPVQDIISVDKDQYSYELPIEPYSAYQITFKVISSKTFSKKFKSQGFIETKFSENIERSEMPTIKAVASSSDITLLFDEWNCQELKGPLYISYKINYNDLCCKSKTVTNFFKLPINDNRLVVSGLMANCTYAIEIRYTRSSNDWDRSRPEFISVHTKARDRIEDDEVPSVNHVNPTISNVQIHFNLPKCVYGPLTLKYHIRKLNEYNSWCDTTSLTSYTLEFPWTSAVMYIYQLKPYCEYKLNMVLVRQYEETESEQPLPEQTFRTKPWVITYPVNNLRVIKQGPDEILLRWLPPNSPTGELRGYVIWMQDGTYYSSETINKCPHEPQYYCHDVRKKYLLSKNMQFEIKIFAYNKYDDDSLLKEINGSTRFASVRACTCESKLPSMVTANWMLDYRVNVTWNYYEKDSTNQTQQFVVRTTLKYRGLEQNYFEQETRDLSKSVDVSFTRTNKLERVSVCVYIKDAYDVIDPTCQPTEEPIPPPLPKMYKVNVTFLNGELIVNVPEDDFVTDDFFSAFYIFKTNTSSPEDELETELSQLRIEIENNTFHKNRAWRHNKLINYGSESFARKVIKEDFRDGLSYNVTLFVVNELNGLRRIRQSSKIIKTHSSVSSRTSLGLTLTLCLFLIFGALFGCFLYRFKFVKLRGLVVRYSRNEDEAILTATVADSEEGTYDHPVLHSLPITIDALQEYIRCAIETRELSKQHQLFPKAEVLTLNNLSFSCAYGNLPQNKAKNRYNNVVAYDHTRVKLNKLPGDEFSDYINANYVDGYKMPKAYIATQGPLPNTVNDFWSMIWEKRVKYVVMLSNLYDGNRKCSEQYWPEGGASLNFNGLRIELVHATSLPTYDVRNLRVILAGSNRQICQIHFKAWPSHGKPLFPQTLVPLLQKMLVIPYNPESPILVHCSAGVGRTGTIIMCDICLRMAAAQGEVDFLATLEGLRNQRPNMVDNVEQYKLAHLAVFACLTSCDMRVSLDGNFEESIKNILAASSMSGLLQRVKDTEWQDDAMKTLATAVQEHNPIVAEKNRYPDILPDPVFQVFLRQLPNQGRASCYINAVRVNSFLCQNRYIVTQQPLSNTLEDFWRLAVEEFATVIINLNPVELEDETSVHFWPDEFTLKVSDNLEIHQTKALIESKMAIYTLKVLYKSNYFEETQFTVKFLDFYGWPADRKVPESIENLVTFAIDASSICKTSSPVIVTCRDGATASGMFVALSNLIEQMQTENVCDVCSTIRNVRVCRKQFVNTEVQIEKLYVATMIYATQFGLYDQIV